MILISLLCLTIVAAANVDVAPAATAAPEVTLAAAPSVFPYGKDTLGIPRIYPDKPCGRAYYSTSWKTKPPRTFSWGKDPQDPMVDAHGDATYSISNGNLTATGDYVRLYIHDAPNEWDDSLEITVYFTRISETQLVSYSGLQIFAHSNHGVSADENANPCDTRGVGAKIKITGQWLFEKEYKHGAPNGYGDLTSGPVPVLWKDMPKGVAIGVKYIIVKTAEGNLRLELWRSSRGIWTQVYTVVDDGKAPGKYAACKPGASPNIPFTCDALRPHSESQKPCTSVYLRCEYCTMNFQKLSIREIDGSKPPFIAMSTPAAGVALKEEL